MNIQNPCKNQSHGIRRVPWLTLCFTAVLTVLYGCGERLFNALQFTTPAVYAGESWRFVTGHFVHCNFEHFFWDALAFVILGAIIEIHERRALVPALMLSCLTVSGWFFWGQTERLAYCGLSGALNGLLIVAIMKLWSETKDNIYLLVIVATIAKIIFEFATQQTIFTSLAAQAVPGAHAAGIIGGVMYVVCSGVSLSVEKR